MTPTGRRGFLRIAGSLPAVSVAPVAVATVVASADVRAGDLVELRRSHFEPLIGQQFLISGPNQSDAGGRSIRLVAVDALGNGTDHERSFRAVFEAVGSQAVSQNTWSMSHPALGEHLVFLSPNDAAAKQLEAVFLRS